MFASTADRRRQVVGTGFKWEGTPDGKETKIAGLNAYVTGSNPDAGVLVIADLFGWKFRNARLLADHYAREANATVYVPDFFGGEELPFEPLAEKRFHEIPDLEGFPKRNGREVREPEIFAVAKELRSQFKNLVAVGFCYGGWAVFRLGARKHQPPLVDAVAAGHPSLLTKQDIDEISVPAQILAPVLDPAYTPELKQHTFETLQKLKVPFDFQFFPGVEHAFLIRGDSKKPGERKSMDRGKNAVVGWLSQHFQAE
ncbi:hypothetical protein HRR78_000701 [Exophiala dermatitidis]|nr:hypothetical protein HRR75_001607 [Exophiala dermatitidis]KAJ4560175.1 hypothetical protein HRR78_000701 [Exophiala dermatitidis]